MVLFAGAIWAEGKKAGQTAAVIAGTVFRDTGFSLPGARITVKGAEKGKKKEWKALADGRGEFIVRLPAGPAEYNLNVTAAGYRTYEKAVTLAADERIDLSIILETDSKKQ
jgi:hypothetical protein